MRIVITNHFFSQLKRLKKKYPNIKEDLLKTLKVFNPKNEIHIGESVYKIRIKSTDINKGKAGGLRAYIYICTYNNLVAPLTIYSKSEKENLSVNELRYHFDKTSFELIRRNLA